MADLADRVTVRMHQGNWEGKLRSYHMYARLLYDKQGSDA